MKNPDGLRLRISPAVLCLLFLCGAATGSAQFKEVGPAPVSPAVARHRIKALLKNVTPVNSQQTIAKLSGLTLWYRDILDDELIAAWKTNDKTNLPDVIEKLADSRTAAGIVDFSWKQQRQITFSPAYSPLLEYLMYRYPDSAKPFLEDMLASTAPGQTLIKMSPPETEAVCRILLDMPDIRTWKKSALQILPRYRAVTESLLSEDLSENDRDKSSRAASWQFALKGPEVPKPRGKTSPPSVIKKVDPQFSDVARKLRANGKVLTSFAVLPDGTASDFKVINSAGYGLDEKAVETLQKWQFGPAMKDGVAVAARATVQTNFQILYTADAWKSGQVNFVIQPGVTTPVVQDGSMPKPDGQVSNESVAFDFTIDPTGAVKNFHAISGSQSASDLLGLHLATWKFLPARQGQEAVEVNARIRFFKGSGDPGETPAFPGPK